MINDHNILIILKSKIKTKNMLVLIVENDHFQKHQTKVARMLDFWVAIAQIPCMKSYAMNVVQSNGLLSNCSGLLNPFKEQELQCSGWFRFSGRHKLKCGSS